MVDFYGEHVMPTFRQGVGGIDAIARAGTSEARVFRDSSDGRSATGHGRLNWPKSGSPERRSVQPASGRCPRLRAAACAGKVGSR